MLLSNAANESQATLAAMKTCHDAALSKQHSTLHSSHDMHDGSHCSTLERMACWLKWQVESLPDKIHSTSSEDASHKLATWHAGKNAASKYEKCHSAAIAQHLGKI
jgi:hypothetical protein